MSSLPWMLKINAANSWDSCWINRGEEKGPDEFVVSVCVVTLPWKTRLYCPRNIRCQLANSDGVKSTEFHVNCLLLFHQMLYDVTFLKSCMIMHLFELRPTTLSGILLQWETVFLNSVRPFFDSIAEGENVKTSFRKSGVSKRVKRKLDALFRVETKKPDKAGY